MSNENVIPLNLSAPPDAEDSKIIQTPWGFAHVSENTIKEKITKSTAAEQAYTQAQKSLSAHGLLTCYLSDFDYSVAPWAPADDSLLKEAQSRGNGLNVENAKEMRECFDEGEEIKNPPILFWTGEFMIPGIGHTRSDAKSKSVHPIGPAFVVPIQELSSMEQRVIILDVATPGNKKNVDTIAVDSMECVGHQAKTWWSQVMDVDIQSESAILADRVMVRKAYLASEDKEKYKKEQFYTYMTGNSTHQFRDKGTQTKIYNMFVSGDGNQPIKPSQWDEGTIAAEYESKFPNNDWDPSTYKADKNSEAEAIHQVVTGFLTFKRNHVRSMFELSWKLGEGAPIFTTEATIYGNPKVSTVESRNTAIVKLVKKIEKYNNDPMRAISRLARYEKLTFLKGLITSEDKTYAYAWNSQKKKFDQV